MEYSEWGVARRLVLQFRSIVDHSPGHRFADARQHCEFPPWCTVGVEGRSYDRQHHAAASVFDHVHRLRCQNDPGETEQRRRTAINRPASGFIGTLRFHPSLVGGGFTVAVRRRHRIDLRVVLREVPRRSDRILFIALYAVLGAMSARSKPACGMT